MKINRTKYEARYEVRRNKRPPEAFGIEDLNPRGQIAKQMEMSCRRSVALHSALAQMLEVTGSVEQTKMQPVLGFSEIDKQMKIALGDRPRRSPLYRYGWSWLVDYWWSGGLQRSVETAMLNMPEENRQRVQKEMDKMQAIEMGDDE